MNADGQLTCPSNAHWPMSMEVALECRAQNVECVLLSNNSLVFTTTKIIDKNQRLYFWFSETLLAQLEMPFLVPKNIQGGDRYVCHRCPAIFSTPNPLKLHLFFQCSPVTLTSLWGRVRQLLVKNRSADSVPLTPRSTNLFLTPIDGTALPNTANFAISAASSCRPLAPTRPPLTSPAEVESLVSNLGRSKHGHICIYCGKIYSRKYGLKIHIRSVDSISKNLMKLI